MEHVAGTPREQITAFPEAVEDYLAGENPVRFLDAFVDSLDAFGIRLPTKNVGILRIDITQGS